MGFQVQIHKAVVASSMFKCGQKEKPALVYHVSLPGGVGRQEERKRKKHAPGYCRAIPSIPAHARGQKTWAVLGEVETGWGGGRRQGRERESASERALLGKAKNL